MSITFLASFLKTETLVMENYCPSLISYHFWDMLDQNVKMLHFSTRIVMHFISQITQTSKWQNNFQWDTVGKVLSFTFLFVMQRSLLSISQITQTSFCLDQNYKVIFNGLPRGKCWVSFFLLWCKDHFYPFRKSRKHYSCVIKITK